MVDAARAQGREMLDEAKAARERVLGDLVRRRALLNAQIEALLRGRDRLLDAYRNVKRTFLEATEALGDVEARAAAERSTTAAEPLDIAAEIAAEIEALEGDSPEIEMPGIETPEIDVDVDVDVVEAETRAAADDDDDRTTGALADVDSLFARLRSNHDAPTVAVITHTGTPAEATETEPAPGTTRHRTMRNRW